MGRQKTAVITGGAGYVGLRLCRRLQAAGYNVVLFDIRRPEGIPAVADAAATAAADEPGANGLAGLADNRKGTAHAPGAADSNTSLLSNSDTSLLSNSDFEDPVPTFAAHDDGERYEPEVPPGARFVTGDICQLSHVIEAFRGADVVFHIASYGMSGVEAMRTALIQKVNVEGTSTVIAACLACGVQRLVYTSTVNTVFEGKPIKGGDESLPLVDPVHYFDAYSRTKAQAEQLVLAADNTPFTGSMKEAAQAVSGAGPCDGVGTVKGEGQQAIGGLANGNGVADAATNRNEDEAHQVPVPSEGVEASKVVTEGDEVQGARRLRTCALRLVGIYGPGECRHFPRLVKMIQWGLLRVHFDQPGSLVDWLHVQNLCDALMAADEALGPEKGAIAGGQAYFITDNQPISNMEFFRAFILGLGYSYPHPKHRLPYRVVFFIGWFFEILYALSLKLFGVVVPPVLSRSEVNKVAVTHWFRIDKAQKQLGYNPKYYGSEHMVPWFRDHGYAAGATAALSGRSAQGQQQGGIKETLVRLLLASMLGLVMVVCLAPVLPGVGLR